MRPTRLDALKRGMKSGRVMAMLYYDTGGVATEQSMYLENAIFTRGRITTELSYGCPEARPQRHQKYDD